MKNIEAGDKAYYNGQPVLVLCVRRVSGGTAADVKRHADATDWPWTVDSFTTAACNLTPELKLSTDSLQYLYETNRASALHWRELANAAAKSGDSRSSTYRELSRQQAEFAREVLEVAK